MSDDVQVNFSTDPAVTKYRKFLMESNRRKREENDKIWAEYNRLLRLGKPEIEVRHELCDRFDWTDRRVQNLILKRTGTLTEAARLEGMAKIIGTVHVMLRNVQEICDGADSELDELEGRKPEEWVEIEQTETTGGKFGDTEQTKKRTVRDIRHDLEDRKLKAYAQFVDAVSKLTQRNIVQVNIGDEVRSKNIDDLNAEIEILEKTLIRGGRQGD